MKAAACFLLFVSIVCVPVFAESGSCGEGVSWTLENGVLTVSGKGSTDDYDTKSYAPWHDVRNRIVSVVIENGVVGVGDNAFFDCANLKNVRISDTLSFIGDCAFLDCVSLETVILGNGLTGIGDSSFAMCTSLYSITLNEGLQNIGSQAFLKCSSLLKITIPSSVTNMGDSVFAYCDNLVQAIVDADIQGLPQWTFYGCDNLTTVSLSANINSLGNSAFYDCDKLKNVYSNTSSNVCDDLSTQIKEDIPAFNSVILSDYDDNESVISYPNFSGVVKENNETENSDMTTSYKPNDESYDYEIDTTIKNESGWTELGSKIESILSTNSFLEQNNHINVNIELDKRQRVNKEFLENFSGENLTLTFVKDGVEYDIDCSNLSENQRFSSLTLNYELRRIEKKDEAIVDAIDEAQGFLLKFKDSCDYSVKVKLFLGIEYARNYASLYQKDGKKWDLIHSVQIDRDGYAPFYLSGFDSLTDYMIGLNVEGVNITNAYVPSELSGDYNGLMDEHGNMYEVTGIQSKWGITLSQFSLIVFGVLGGVIVLVGLVMFIIFKMQQNKEKIRREVTNESKNKK